MKMTFQMEMNLSGEKDLRRWKKQERRERVESQREMLGWWETGTKLAAELIDQLEARKRRHQKGVAVPIAPMPFAAADPLGPLAAPKPFGIDPLPFGAHFGADLKPPFEDVGRSRARRRSPLAEAMNPFHRLGVDDEYGDGVLHARVKQAGKALKRFGERFRRIEQALERAGLLYPEEADRGPLDPETPAGLGDNDLETALDGGRE